MTDKTKKHFFAPWTVKHHVHACWEVDFEVSTTNGMSVAVSPTEEHANRIARLPELYDALLKSVCTSCNVCIYDHCDSPVDCEQLLSQECTYEDSKLCFEHKARELLKKVRDGNE